MTARVAAARVLVRLTEPHTTLAAELDRVRGPLNDRRDRGLLVELAAGTLRWRAELDALIASASRRPLRDVDARVLAVLRLGAYQLRHLERIPAHAIVDESVEAVRTLGVPRAAGFVNAVLRRLTRDDVEQALPRRPSDDAPPAAWVSYLATTLSHPAWLVERWVARYGASATERWCRFNNASPPTVVRPIRGTSAADLIQRLHDAGLDAAPARFVRDAVVLSPGVLGKVPRALAEHIHVQDEGSQLVARAVGARPGETALDVCAAPGGKTLVMALDAGLGQGGASPGGRRDGQSSTTLVAADVRPGRVALLARTLETAGVSVPIVTLDARHPLPFGAVFDVVLLDAPCSGLGTLRRDPDLKWSRHLDDLPALIADERRMLSRVADVVRPGGRLIYATCSSEPEENAGVVEAFLEADDRFILEPLREPAVPRSLVDAHGRLATLPHRDELDAFFAAQLVRRRAT